MTAHPSHLVYPDKRTVPARFDMPQPAQTEKYSERADIFRSSADNSILGGRLARLSSGGRECFHSIQYSANAPWRAPCPRLSGLTRFCDLLAGWKLDSFLLIRYRHEIPFAYKRPLCAAVDHEFCLGEIQTARSLHRPSRRTRGSWASDSAVALQLLPKREVTEFALCDLRSRENLRVSEHRPLWNQTHCLSGFKIRMRRPRF